MTDHDALPEVTGESGVWMSAKLIPKASSHRRQEGAPLAFGESGVRVCGELAGGLCGTLGPGDGALGGVQLVLLLALLAAWRCGFVPCRVFRILVFECLRSFNSREVYVAAFG